MHFCQEYGRYNLKEITDCSQVFSNTKNASMDRKMQKSTRTETEKKVALMMDEENKGTSLTQEENE
jgi:hypothetical protein